jgi:hypothetical protein
MPDLWFVAGLAIGVALTGFCAVGSFERGAESVRRGPWALELAARRRAVIASRTREHAFAMSLSKAQVAVTRVNARQTVNDDVDRLGRAITNLGLATTDRDQDYAMARRA